MNTAPIQNSRPAKPRPEPDFENMNPPEITVEMDSIPGYLRKKGHRFHMREVTKFGKDVGDAAEAMHVAYLTKPDSALGLIRIFPVPLLDRIYGMLAKTFGWPVVVEIEEAGDALRALREELKKLERADRSLQEIIERTDSVAMLASVQGVRDFLQGDMARVREMIDAPVEASGVAAKAGA